jgi:hypothetical protein
MPDIFVGSSEKEKPFLKTSPKKPNSKIIDRRPLGFFSAFALHPHRLRYEAQEADEKIILFLRRHFFTNVGWILATFCLILVPFFAYSFFDFGFIPLGFRVMGIIGWYLLTFAFGFERFLSWFFNVNIVTDQRIIDVNFPSILYKDISETKLENVQDISSKTGGFVRSFLNYGDVMIQTAGALPELNFEAVPHPDKVAEVINDLQSGRKDYQHDAL